MAFFSTLLSLSFHSLLGLGGGGVNVKPDQARPEAKRSQGRTQGDGSQHHHRVAPETMTGVSKELGCRPRASPEGFCPVLFLVWPRRAKAKVLGLSGPTCLLLGACCSQLAP